MYWTELHLGFLTISTTKLMLLLGILSMGVIIWTQRRRYDLNGGQAVMFTLLLTVVGVSGVKLLYILENFKAFLATGEAGMSFFGAVFLIPLVMPVVGRFFRMNGRQTLDLCAPCVASIVGFMRVSCFLTGCCGGRVVHLMGRAFLFPAQLFELTGDFTVAYLLLMVPRFQNQEGKKYPVFLIFYGVMRFLLELVRINPKGLLGLTNGQWFSLVGIVLGLGMLRCIKKSSTEEEHERMRKQKTK